VRQTSRSNGDRKNGVPRTLTTIPLTDPNADSVEQSIGELVKDATAQMSTLLRAEVELARAEISRDVKKGLTGSVFFISALVVLFYSTFFFFFFLAELLDTWLWRWVAFLIVFAIMTVVTVVLAVFGYLKLRRISGPRQTIKSVKETRTAFTTTHDNPPSHDKPGPRAVRLDPPANSARAGIPAEPSGW
jgi:phosphoglycerol transferase MdoB-like AlkP superfamily enzyme